MCPLPTQRNREFSNYRGQDFSTLQVLYTSIASPALNGYFATAVEGSADPLTPLSASLPIFATVFGLAGSLGWRRKRKNVAATAAA